MVFQVLVWVAGVLSVLSGVGVTAALLTLDPTAGSHFQIVKVPELQGQINLGTSVDVGVV